MKNFCRVEPFDLMQYFYRRAHDPIIHAVIHTNGRMNPNLLGEAFRLSCQTVPVVGCSFSVEEKRPRWKAQKYTNQAFVQLLQPETDEEAAEQWFLTSTVDIAAGPQVKAGVIRKRGGDTLCVLINHMVCDGGGFKEYLYLICSLYNSLSEGDSPPISSPITRSIRQIFSGFRWLERVKLSLPPWSIPSLTHPEGFALHGDRSNPFIGTREISAQGLATVKQRARENGATVNDMLLAAYASVLCRSLGWEDILIPCPVDLSKYLRAGMRRGICNLTSNYMCSLHVGRGDSFSAVLRQAAEQMSRQKKSNECLKPLKLLSALFSLFPFRTLQKIFNRIFTIPVISYTNFGILDEAQLRFHGVEVTGAFLTGAIKYVPYFQVAASTFRGRMTLSCNLHGTQADRVQIERVLQEIQEELQTL